ncbi:MAG: hypothetical protein KDB27_19610 [Planctomycetales bacterium]|nr:hypothetical protein [Planctomycetales bacterium]
MAHDLDRIRRMLDGDQRLAAIEKIDSLLKKRSKDSEKVALLMMKSEAEMELGEREACEQTVNEVLALEPKNASALAVNALLRLTDEDLTVREALDNLQESVRNVQEIMTRTVYEAVIGTVMFLYSRGQVFSAKGYLQFAVMLTDGKDARCVQLLNGINRSSDMDFFLREHIDSSARPANVTWAREFDVAMHIASQGNWSDASEMLKSMSNRILDEPAILRNLAIIQALNAENDEAAKTFRQFAALRRLPMLDRVHAEALATAISPESSNALIDLVKTTIEIQNTDDVVEAFLSDKRFQSFDLPPAGDGKPAPKAGFRVFDRELPPDDSDDVTLDNLPFVQSTALVYGKQTDREARIELILPRGSKYAEMVAAVTDKLGDNCLEVKDEPDVMNATSELQVEVFGSPFFGVIKDPEKRRELTLGYRRKALLEIWPGVPRAFLGGKTPREVAKETPDDLKLNAELLGFEVESETQSWDFNVDEIREAIGLPPREKIDLSKRKIEHVPVSHLGRVDIEGLSDDDLLKVYRYSYAVMAGGILYRIALEISKRESLKDHEKVDLVEIYDVLSDLSTESDESLEWLEKARKLATAQGESPALWLIDEMEIRLLRGDVERFQTLFKEIQTRYSKEPGVSSALFDLFRKYGLVTPDGRLATNPEAASVPEEEAEPVGVWTPDGDKPAESGTESKIWVPD